MGANLFFDENSHVSLPLRRTDRINLLHSQRAAQGQKQTVELPPKRGSFFHQIPDVGELQMHQVDGEFSITSSTKADAIEDRVAPLHLRFRRAGTFPDDGIDHIVRCRAIAP